MSVSVSYQVTTRMGLAGYAKKPQQPSRITVDSKGNVYGAFSVSGSTQSPSSASTIIKSDENGENPIDLYAFNSPPRAIGMKTRFVGTEEFLFVLMQNITPPGPTYTNSPYVLKLKLNGSSDVNAASSRYATLPSEAAYVQDFVFSVDGSMYIGSGNTSIQTTPTETVTQGLIVKVLPGGVSSSIWSVDALYNANLVSNFRTRYDNQQTTIRSLGSVNINEDESALFINNIDAGTILQVPIINGFAGKASIFAQNPKLQSCNTVKMDKDGDFWLCNANLDSIIHLKTATKTYETVIDGHAIIDSPLSLEFKKDTKNDKQMWIVNSGFLRMRPDLANSPAQPTGYKGGLPNQNLALLTVSE